MLFMGMRLCAVAALTSLLGACATSTAGIAEFRYFDEAYRAQAVAGETVLDSLAVSERKLWRRTFEARTRAATGAVIPPFDPDDAPYLIEIGDPPLTAAIRDSLDYVTRYNDAMTGLATGEAGAALSARMGDAAVSAAGAAGAFGAAAGLPQGAAFAVAAEGAVALVKPLFTQLAQLNDRAEFRKLLIEAYPSVRALLLELRAGASAMFDVHKEAYKTRGALGGAVEGVLLADLPKLEEERMRLAAWILLIDQAVPAMDEAALAVTEGRSDGAAALVAASLELSRLAENVRFLRAPLN